MHRAVPDRSTAAEEVAPLPAFDLVHAEILRFFPDLVAELGGDADALLARVGIDPSAYARGRPDATYRQMCELLELAAAEFACPDFGLRLARLQRDWRVFGPLGLVMRNSRTFGEGLEYSARHIYAHSLAARMWLKHLPDDEGVICCHDILLDRVANKSQVVEQIMLIGHLAAMEMTGGYARARSVHFRHQPALPIRIYRRYFGCDVLFGQAEDGLGFHARDMACPVVDHDAEAFRAATEYIETGYAQQTAPLRAQARGAIMHLLETGDCTNERVAAELGIHLRTLHRRLAAEGSSFQALKDEVRRDVMLYFLEHTELDFTRIVEKLGFAEQSVMTRRCRRWFGTTPSAIRARARRSVPAIRAA